MRRAVSSCAEASETHNLMHIYIQTNVIESMSFARENRHVRDNTEQVLVVDDDRDIREVLRYTLEDAGYRVFEASDGLEALKILHATSHPLVVLLDRMMPRLDGPGVLRAVLEDPVLAAHRYLLVTAYYQSLPPTLRDLLQQLSVPVVPKPFDIDDLVEMVHQVIEVTDEPPPSE